MDKTFEEWMQMVSAECAPMEECPPWVLGGVVRALQALAAERTAERRRGPVSFAEFRAGQETAQPPCKPMPYERALKLQEMAESLGVQHPPAFVARRRVAMARDAAPEPATIGHWGMW